MDDLGAPQLTPALVDALVQGVDDELAGAATQAALVARRDALLLQLLAAKAAATDLP